MVMLPIVSFLALRYPISSHPHPAVPAHCVRSWGGRPFQLQRPAGSPHQRLPPLQARRVHTVGHSEGGPDPDAGGADAVRRGDLPAGQLQLSLQDQGGVPHSADQLSTQQLHQHHCRYVGFSALLRPVGNLARQLVR